MKSPSSRNSKLIVSSFEYPLESRGSLRASTSTFPPLGLAIVTSYPFSTNNLYACVNSAAQKPTGQPVVVEVVGFDTTINILVFSFSIFLHWIVKEISNNLDVHIANKRLNCNTLYYSRPADAKSQKNTPTNISSRRRA